MGVKNATIGADSSGCFAGESGSCFSNLTSSWIGKIPFLAATASPLAVITLALASPLAWINSIFSSFFSK